MFRIVCLVGILDSAKLKTPAKGMTPMWKQIRRASKNEFPESYFASTRCYYWHYGKAKVEEYKQRILRMYDKEGDKILLVGQSMGGLHACDLAGQFKKAKVVGVVTINTPHNSWYGGFSRYFGGNKKLSVPVVSFGATRDWLVPFGTQHPQAIVHRMFDADHQEDLKVNRDGIVDKMFKIIKEVFGGLA